MDAAKGLASYALAAQLAADGTFIFIFTHGQLEY